MTNIYKITNKMNGKVYIGQTKRSIHIRFSEHYTDSSSSLFLDMHKLGKGLFTVELLHVCKDEFANQWERYYICKYNSIDSECGYNKVCGGIYKWEKGGYNPSKTDNGKARISCYNKQHIDTITIGLKRYNESKKFPVAMLDDYDNVLMLFNSLSDACRYLQKDLCGTARIKQVCDKYNKNGKRSKFFGYAWSALNKDVQTNTNNVCKVEDELPSE